MVELEVESTFRYMETLRRLGYNIPELSPSCLLYTSYAPKQPEEDWNPLFVEALHRQPYIAYLLDLLLSDSIEERAFVVVEYGKEVRKIEQRCV